MNFANSRVDAHNQWPKSTRFKGEDIFAKRLSSKGGVAPFRPISISQNEDPEYQRCVGHLLDALDQIPTRPDYAFDHFFRIIDMAGCKLFPKKGVKGVAQGMGAKLLAYDRVLWETLIDALCGSMPLRTFELLAKRVLAAEPSAPDPNPSLHNRAQNAFGQAFHAAFISKYTLDAAGNPIANAADVSRADAAKLLKLFMSGNLGSRAKPATNPALDLTNIANIPSYARRSEVMLSLLLFTLRNERAHGNTISPFRTSKSSIERYQSHYFTMLVAYIFALGILGLRFNCVTPSDLRDGCTANIQAQQLFFS